jgi:hypothetical protein
MKNDNTEDKALNKTDVISRLSSKEALYALEILYQNMSNPKIVESLKEQFDRDGYKAGFCDGFRTAIRYALNGL